MHNQTKRTILQEVKMVEVTLLFKINLQVYRLPFHSTGTFNCVRQFVNQEILSN